MHDTSLDARLYEQLERRLRSLIYYDLIMQIDVQLSVQFGEQLAWSQHIGLYNHIKEELGDEYT
jgi:hypothetical protein